MNSPSIDDVANVNSDSLAAGVDQVEGKSRGSELRPRYLHRRPKYYPVTEDELDQVTDFNKLSTFFFSCSGLFLGLSIDLAKDQAITADMPKVAEAVIPYVNIGSAIMAVICFAIGFYVNFKKQERVKKVISDSVED
ncbi:hypothetical protein VQ042_01405 [Aurantimonas sp. A2-1-M11]|uniref:hypothetical protein n=1 Tax=Aurantimonas sp. A2-1-M11 TaxID=3113712 RepID=UPI002F955362